jgi:L-aspartate oxidase
VDVRIFHSDYLIIGSGVAGLFCALKACAHGNVSLLTRDSCLVSNTALAQGGIAAALKPGDSPLLHLRDTLAAGAGGCFPPAVEVLVKEGVERVQELIALGMPFDHLPGGALAVTREGAHSLARVIPALGDATGLAMARTLLSAVSQQKRIRIKEGVRALELVMHQGRCRGVLAWQPEGRPALHLARAVVLATGGLGQIYSRTTGSRWCNGSGLAMAVRAGAQTADLEYVQFHPTALACGEDPLPLISEAVRGQGAILVDQLGRRFMLGRHPMAELAPRDVVARAIFGQELAGRKVFLDATAMGKGFAKRFPSIFAACQKRGIDPSRQPMPVTPAAHFLMGGVKSDLNGASSLPGLLVCGETACTGVHGANRLASNSLLEGLVFGHRAAAALAQSPALPPELRSRRQMAAREAEDMIAGSRGLEHCLPRPHDPRQAEAMTTKLRQIMWSHAGLVRRADSLIRALDLIGQIEEEAPPGALDLRDMTTAARLVVRAALARRESRGSHFREDYPPPPPPSESLPPCAPPVSDQRLAQGA